MFSRTSRLNQKPVVLRIFRVLHTVQFSRFVVVCSQQQLVYPITTRCVCQQLFYFLFGSFPKPFQISLKLPCHSQRRVISYHNFASVSSTFLKFSKICFSSAASGISPQKSLFFKADDSAYVLRWTKLYHRRQNLSRKFVSFF